jgi:hypothetical protein
VVGAALGSTVVGGRVGTVVIGCSVGVGVGSGVVGLPVFGMQVWLGARQSPSEQWWVGTQLQ